MVDAPWLALEVLRIQGIDGAARETREGAEATSAMR